MKRLLLLLILSIFWTLAGTQISLPAASVQPDAAPVAPVGASAADTAATQTVIVADPAVDSLSDPAPNAAEPVVRMTLDECMAYAVEHSPVVRQQDYTNRNYRQDYIESVAALVPSVSGSVSATTSFGRSVDPETNTYTDVSNLSNNYGVSGQMPVFAGFTGINTIRAAKVMRLMGVEELQRVKDEVALNTMQAYFDVVYYTESVRLAREQLETSTGNLAKSRKLLELGLKSAADVAEQEAQCASDDYLLTQQENNLELARITLAETMNYPPDRPLGIETDLAIETPAGTAPFSDVVAYALDNNPKARSAGYNVRQSKLQYSVARGGFFPSVYVGGGYSTNFFMSLDDHSLYEPFKNQFRDNRGYYFSAQLNIPISGAFAPHEDEPRPQQLADRRAAARSDVACPAKRNRPELPADARLRQGVRAGQQKKRGLRAGLQRRRRQVRPGHGFGARPSDRRQQPVAGPLRTVACPVAIHYQNAPGRVLQRCAPDPLTKNRK